jgi:hypothetical protein
VRIEKDRRMRLFGDVERHALILRSHLDPELRKEVVP